MSDELMPFNMPEKENSIIKVIGVGGGGCNAVNHMYQQGIKDVNFVVANTDAQALENSPVEIKVQLGATLTEGRGAGNVPDKGKQAAIENIDDIKELLNEGTKMVFITAGMGGGTGTGAAPVIAKTTKEMEILTVAIVTIPFRFEGQRRIRQAYEGIKELQNNVDSLLVINNEKLREIHGDLKLSDAFSHADDILTVAAKGIAEIITVHGHLNVDFADVQTVMKNSGVALMGSATASGEDRALEAIQQALSSPLLNNNDINGAKDILLNVTSGSEEASMDEIGKINEYVQEAAGYNADLIWGNTTDPKLGDKINVTVIATGFKTDIFPEMKEKEDKKEPNPKETQKEEKVNPNNNVFSLNETENDINSLFNTTAEKTEDNTNETEAKRAEQFILKDELNENNEYEVRTSASNTIKKQYKAQQEKKKNSYSDDIDELENTPAYIRKGLKLKGEKKED